MNEYFVFEELLKSFARSHGLAMQDEYRFDYNLDHEPDRTLRKWRFDYAVFSPYVASIKLGIEIEGGIFSRGRHTRGKGYKNDIEKYNRATLLRYTLFRITSQDAKNENACVSFMQMLDYYTDRYYPNITLR